jgi:hypothetical protein
MMEVARLSETLAAIYMITLCHIPEDINLHSHCCENLTPHICFPEREVHIGKTWNVFL